MATLELKGNHHDVAVIVAKYPLLTLLSVEIALSLHNKVHEERDISAYFAKKIPFATKGTLKR